MSKLDFNNIFFLNSVLPIAYLFPLNCSAVNIFLPEAEIDNLILLSIEVKDWWKKKLGPKNSALEKCNLGLGPGEVMGATKALPKFFFDDNQFHDVKSRLKSCMVKHQGFNKFVINSNYQYHKIVSSITVWLHDLSKTETFSVSQVHDYEKKMYTIGKNVFFFNSFFDDFAFSICLASGGKDLRQFPLVNNLHETAKIVLNAYPKYDVSNNKVIFIKDHISKCFFEQGIANKSYHDFHLFRF